MMRRSGCSCCRRSSSVSHEALCLEYVEELMPVAFELCAAQLAASTDDRVLGPDLISGVALLTQSGPNAPARGD